jgi:S-(hydroxymethyl)glutathione synthase
LAGGAAYLRLAGPLFDLHSTSATSTTLSANPPHSPNLPTIGVADTLTPTMSSIHPAIDNGVKKGDPNFKGGKLYCHCANQKVEVTLSSNVAHNHACGCSKCWKPKGALFSVVGVVPVDAVKVTANENKLHIVDSSAVIQRNACKDCGVHLFGRIHSEHPFKGLDFVHTELSDTKGWQEPQFAAFVSSIIEQGFKPTDIDGVREKFKKGGLPTYDVLSPVLMDLIAAHTAQKNGKMSSKL